MATIAPVHVGSLNPSSTTMRVQTKPTSAAGSAAHVDADPLLLALSLRLADAVDGGALADLHQALDDARLLAKVLPAERHEEALAGAREPPEAAPLVRSMATTAGAAKLPSKHADVMQKLFVAALLAGPIEGARTLERIDRHAASVPKPHDVQARAAAEMLRGSMERAIANPMGWVAACKRTADDLQLRDEKVSAERLRWMADAVAAWPAAEQQAAGQRHVAQMKSIFERALQAGPVEGKRVLDEAHAYAKSVPPPHDRSALELAQAFRAVLARAAENPRRWAAAQHRAADIAESEGKPLRAAEARRWANRVDGWPRTPTSTRRPI
jgi:hypothetical protein